LWKMISIRGREERGDRERARRERGGGHEQN
jgi:hypothetical protein